MKRIGILLFLLLALTYCSKKEKNTSGNIQTLGADNYTISFEYKDFEKKYGDCVNEENCVEVKIHYPQLLSGTEAIRQINDSIMSLLLNEEDEEMHYQSFDDIADTLIAEYKSVQKEFEDYNIGWFIHKNLELANIVKNYLSVRNEVIMYTGGANDYYNIDLLVFDLNTGKQIEFEQLVREDKLNDLLQLGEQEFKKLKGLSPDINIDKSGFWFVDDQFYFPFNYNLTDSGFVFFYNLYEIAPRSEGYTELFIPKDKIKPFLKNENLFD